MKNTLLAFSIFLVAFQVSARSITAKTEAHDKTATSALVENNGKPPPLALLPPAQQNMIDLQTMMEFLMQEENQSIAATLESIDLKNISIEFNQGCKAVFMREENDHSDCGQKRLLGPAGSLKLAYIICS